MRLQILDIKLEQAVRLTGITGYEAGPHLCLAILSKASEWKTGSDTYPHDLKQHFLGDGQNDLGPSTPLPTSGCLREGDGAVVWVSEEKALPKAFTGNQVQVNLLERILVPGVGSQCLSLVNSRNMPANPSCHQGGINWVWHVTWNLEIKRTAICLLPGAVLDGRMSTRDQQLE